MVGSKDKLQFNMKKIFLLMMLLATVFVACSDDDDDDDKGKPTGKEKLVSKIVTK